MSFFKKLKKGLKGALKIAKVAAPIAAGFFPGGGVATQLLSKYQTVAKIGRGVAAARKIQQRIKPALTLAKAIQGRKNAGKGFPGLPSWDARDAVMQSPSGVAGRVGRLHARRIAQMRGTRRQGGIGSYGAYRRAARLKPARTYLNRRRRMTAWAV